jgi:transposase
MDQLVAAVDLSTQSIIAAEADGEWSQQHQAAGLPMDTQGIIGPTTTIEQRPRENAQRQTRHRPMIPTEVRTRFIAYVLATPNASLRSISKTFGIADSTAYDIMRRFEETGDMSAKKKHGQSPLKMTPEALQSLERWIDENADLTLRALGDMLREQLGVIVSKKTISKALTKLGFTFKLLRALPLSRNTTEAIQSRKEYAEIFLRDMPADRRTIIWLDECGFNLHLRRRHGRARSGMRATVTVPNSRGHNLSVCAAMSEEGLLHYSPIQGAFNMVRFGEFLQSLFAILRVHGRSSCWIVLDNVRFHHCPEIREIVVEAGHTLMFLPAYSPMLNPIESLFGKWKTGIRTRNVTFTQQALRASMDASWSEISIEDCLGWIRDVNQNLILCLQDHVFH